MIREGGWQLHHRLYQMTTVQNYKVPEYFFCCFKTKNKNLNLIIKNTLKFPSYFIVFYRYIILKLKYFPWKMKYLVDSLLGYHHISKFHLTSSRTTILIPNISNFSWELLLHYQPVLPFLLLDNTKIRISWFALWLRAVIEKICRDSFRNLRNLSKKLIKAFVFEFAFDFAVS